MIEMLNVQERVANILEKMMLHVLYTDYEVMTGRQMKIFVTGCIETACNRDHTRDISMLISWIELLIETNDSYVEHWDGARDDLAFLYDELVIRNKVVNNNR
jgi:dissimilatory sulfite reductase (desulfoviridin) alpha/beta subunit